MTNKHGDFMWYELLTSDADAAGDFYGKVVGWTSTHSGQQEKDYRFFSSGDGSEIKDFVGGYMAITPEMAQGGARPAWVGYIAVDDVDACAAAITKANGSVLMPAMDLEGVGRMAMVADPQGAPFYIMKGASEEASHSFAATEPKVGHCAWNELATSDPEAAKAFYSAQFRWAEGGSMDMGPIGSYDFLKVGDDRAFNIGAVYPKVPEDLDSHWLFYFRVPDIDQAVETVKANGGRILQEPIEIPDGGFSIVGYDPHGGAFGLVGSRK
jgi:uncharacterized protein